MRNNDAPQIEDPHAALERTLIHEFLESVGHTRGSVKELEPSEYSRLLRAASEYASLRLAEIDSRAHYADEIHRSS